MFDPSAIPLGPGQLLLVTDKIAASADFVVVNILATRLKASTQSCCVLVSFSQSLTHWSSIGSKLSPPTNLKNAIADTSLVFVDAQTELLTKSLNTVYTKISDALKHLSVLPRESSATVIIDGLSQAEWTGFPKVEVKRFIRAVCTLCTQSRASLIIRLHRLKAGELDDLLRDLLIQCSWHLEVLPLSSGRSGAITGELALHAGPLCTDHNTFGTFKRSEAVQYRLNDTGAVYFGRGTSSSVL